MIHESEHLSVGQDSVYEFGNIIPGKQSAVPEPVPGMGNYVSGNDIWLLPQLL